MNTKIRCVILDDELPGLAYLKALCEQFKELEIVKAFNNPKLFLSEIDKLDFDLCILDIEMGEINGIEVASILKNKMVIFVTAYKEYAAEAFDLDAIDYVRKPLQKDRLYKAVEKAVERMELKLTNQHDKKAIQLNSDKGKVLLYSDEIGYITISETDSRDKEVHLLNGKNIIIKNISFERLLELFSEGAFCRINKKEMISLTIVQYFTYDEIISSIIYNDSPKKFVLSSVYRGDFLRMTDI